MVGVAFRYIVDFDFHSRDVGLAEIVAYSFEERPVVVSGVGFEVAGLAKVLQDFLFFFGDFSRDPYVDVDQ